jgi:hypothetical protein
MGCKYIEAGVGMYCTCFLFHSRFKYSMSCVCNEADCFIVCLLQDHSHSRTASNFVLAPLIRFLLVCLEESLVTLKLT